MDRELFPLSLSLTERRTYIAVYFVFIVINLHNESRLYVVISYSIIDFTFQHFKAIFSKLFLDIFVCVVYNIDIGYIPYCKKESKSLFDIEYYRFFQLTHIKLI